MDVHHAVLKILRNRSKFQESGHDDQIDLSRSASVENRAAKGIVPVTAFAFHDTDGNRRFMSELEWGHPGLPELRLVEDLRTRKHLMLSESDAVVALPGGSGTLEELLEAITLKRLGLFVGPIVLVDTRGYFEPLLALLRRAVDGRFMGEPHLVMWSVVAEPEQVPDALRAAARWSPEAVKFAAL